MTDDPTDDTTADGSTADGSSTGDSSTGSPIPGPGPGLRRNSSDRVLAGVAGGLGRYFGVDPVLFRVLFATTAFFGGVGVLAYLLGWVLIPDEGTVDPPIDRLIADLRRRRIPFWLVVGVLAVVAWSALAHNWRPWGLGPIIVAGAILAVALSKRREGSAGHPADPPRPDGTGIGAPADPATDPTPVTRTPWIESARAWNAESREAARQRRHRKAPVQWAAFGALVVGLGVTALLDVTRGVPMVAYGWVLLFVGLGALVVGGMMRRTPWLNAVWALLGLLVIVAFSGSPVSLTDGTGDQLLVPHTAVAIPTEIRLAAGRTTLDLTALPTSSTTRRTVHIQQGVGKVVIRLPRSSAIAVDAHVHIGSVIVDGSVEAYGGTGVDGTRTDGVGVTRHVAGSTSGPSGIRVEAQLADGVIEIDHVGT